MTEVVHVYGATMAIISKSGLIETVLGALKVELIASGPGLSNDSLSVECRPIRPELPDGMGVTACRAVLLKVDGGQLPFGVSYSASLDSSVGGHACSGQGLEAMEWDHGNRIIVVGTEDSEALAGRMPWLELDPYLGLATYTSTALGVSIVAANHRRPASFHVIVAENAFPEPAELSAWFAVDVAHNEVLDFF